MVYKLKKMLPAAVMGLTLGVVCNSAMAASVALSVNEITNFSLTASSGGSVTLTGFTFSNSTAATENGGTGTVDLQDALASCVGDCDGWENQFSSHTSSTEFSYGDANIFSSDILNGIGAASSIGEVVVIDGVAHASGSNVLTSFGVNIGAGTVLDFGLTFDSLLQTSGLGASNMFFDITLKDSSQATVFSWIPEELNHGITGDSIYDITGSLSAQTGMLAGGSYTLNIKMENQVNATVVPAPAAVWLFGTGLLGLVGVARRRV